MVLEDEGDKVGLCFVVHHLYYSTVLQTEASVLSKDQRTEDRGEGIAVNDKPQLGSRSPKIASDRLVQTPWSLPSLMNSPPPRPAVSPATGVQRSFQCDDSGGRTEDDLHELQYLA